MLRHYINPAMDDWDKHLPLAEFAINNAWQESIHNTPFNVVYGSAPLTPAQLACPDQSAKAKAAQSWLHDMQHNVTEAKRHMLNAREWQEFFADRKRAHIQFAVGNKVVLSTATLLVKGQLFTISLSAIPPKMKARGTYDKSITFWDDEDGHWASIVISNVGNTTADLSAKK